MKNSKQVSHLQKRETLIQVAHLYYEENLSQREIADRLGVSRSLIAYYIRCARESGVVHIKIIDHQDACVKLADELKQAFSLKHATIVPNSHVSNELTLRAVSAAAAHFICNTTQDNERIGFGWGRSISAVVDNLELSSPSLNVSVFPLMGECDHAGMHSQMNQLVVRAAVRMQAIPYFLSLPMVVSRSELRRMLLQETVVKDVVELWDKLTLVCVGIGVVPPLPEMLVYLGEENIPQLVAAGAVGDICGIYYDRQGYILESGLEDRIIAAHVQQLQKASCSMAVASGREKAWAVLGAIRSKIISAIFVDQNLAEQLLFIQNQEN